MRWLAAIFSDPAKQATAWAVMGIGGLLLAGMGLFLVLDDSGNGGSPPAASAPAIRTPSPANPGASGTTRNGPTQPAPTSPATQPPVSTVAGEQPPTATQPPAATATAPQAATSTPAPSATPQPTQTPQQTPIPTATPTPSPTPPLLTYCTSGTFGAAIAGTVNSGGQPAAPGTLVTLVFAGTPGPAAETGEGGGFLIGYMVGEAGCANEIGNPIAVRVGGITYGTGLTSGQSGEVVIDTG